MESPQKSYINPSWRGWLTGANFIILILIFFFKSGFTSGEEVTKIKNDIKTNGKDIVKHKVIVDKHITDESVHMPLEKKIKIFVPRVELEGKFENITKQLDRIEKKLDKK